MSENGMQAWLAGSALNITCHVCEFFSSQDEENGVLMSFIKERVPSMREAVLHRQSLSVANHVIVAWWLDNKTSSDNSVLQLEQATKSGRALHRLLRQCADRVRGDRIAS